MSHTPGPWEVHTNIGRKSEMGVIADAAPFVICVISNAKQWPIEADANARLIAAAPELLAACEALERWSRDRDGGAYLEGLKWTKDIQDAVCDARAAIAKAKGGAHA